MLYYTYVNPQETDFSFLMDKNQSMRGWAILESVAALQSAL